MRGIQRWSVYSRHEGSVIGQNFSICDVISTCYEVLRMVAFLGIVRFLVHFDGINLEMNATNCLTHWGRDKMAATLADDIFSCNFVNENISISIKIWLKVIPKDPINNVPAVVQIMAWRLPATSHYLNQLWSTILTHTCDTRWVNARRDL